MILRDKKGRPFQVFAYRPKDEPFLKRMYDDFTPKARFQGMPPEDGAVRCRWIDRLLRYGRNFLAWNDIRVVGHVAIMPDPVCNDAEYLIFIDKIHRGAGIGRALTEAAIGCARDLRLRRVWLTVDAYNFPGIRLYRHMGFRFREEHSSVTERTMELIL